MGFLLGVQRAIKTETMFLLSFILMSALIGVAFIMQGAPEGLPGLVVYCLVEDGMSKAWVEPPGPISFYFVHSVYKTSETDVLEPDWNGLWLVEVRLESFGAGTPYNLGDLGGMGAVIFEDGRVVFKDLRVYRGRSIDVSLEVWENIEIRVNGKVVSKDCMAVSLIVPPLLSG